MLSQWDLSRHAKDPQIPAQIGPQMIFWARFAKGPEAFRFHKSFLVNQYLKTERSIHLKLQVKRTYVYQY